MRTRPSNGRVAVVFGESVRGGRYSTKISRDAHLFNMLHPRPGDLQRLLELIFPNESIRRIGSVFWAGDDLAINDNGMWRNFDTGSKGDDIDTLIHHGGLRDV